MPAADPRRRTVIAVVSDAIFPYHKGGKEVRYRDLVQRLAAAGYEVHVYTMHWWDGPAERTEDGVTYHALCRRHPLYVASGRRSVLEAVAFSLACFRLLFRSFDVLEADHMPYLQLFPLRLVAWLKRRRLCVTWHEVWGRDYWRRYFGRWGLLGAAIERLAMNVPDQIVTDAEMTRERLIDCGVPAARISMIPVGVDRGEIEAAPPSASRFDVVYVGRLVEHKGVDVLLGAVAELRARGRAVSCGVVGSGPERDRLERLAGELGVLEQVRFLGNVESQSDVYGLMKSAGVLALPSVREGFGVVVVEALMCGTPVITTDHPDNHSRLLLEDGANGLICTPTVGALADAIHRCLDRQGGIAVDVDAVHRAHDGAGLLDQLRTVYETV